MAGIRASAVGWGLTKLDDPAISANPAGPMAVAAARERYGTGSQRRTILMMPQTTASQRRGDLVQRIDGPLLELDHAARTVRAQEQTK